MCAVCTGERSELEGDRGIVSPLHIRAVDLPCTRRYGMLHRNPWTEAAIESLRANPHLQLPIQGPVRVLGELRGLGKSWFVALAYPSSDRHRQGLTALRIALVVPARGRHVQVQGWAVQSATVSVGVTSPSATLQMATTSQCGLCFTLGALIAPDAEAVRLELPDGGVAQPDLRDRGFLFVSEEEPYPLDVVVLDTAGQTVERFRFPPH